MGNEMEDEGKRRENNEQGKEEHITKGSTIVKLSNNWISLFGGFLATVMAFLILVNVGLSVFAGQDNPYGGIFVYILFLPTMILGLSLVPLGMYRSWRKWQTAGKISYKRWPTIDINIRSHRIAVFVTINVAIVFILISMVVSYEAYHWAESPEFCGELCHEVMGPEFVAYDTSPHARVACIHCHIGGGVSYYAKAKITGSYQLYGVLTNTYPKPIPTPLKNLRPAQDLCEECHWPQQFFGGEQEKYNHYMYDEENTHWPINMLIKVGGGDPENGQKSGIHWHMNIGTKVEYLARDERRQDIPWVKVTDLETGDVRIYQDENDPLTEEEIAAATPRQMDCMDCHNRPAHIFQSPDFAIDMAILTGQIDQDIPYIKRIAVEALTEEYENEEEALHGIANYITEYYRLQMPEMYRENRVEIDKAIVSTQDVFSKNIFPEMKVRWSNYLDNIGHFDNPGCMRCHLGDHKDEKGIAITHNCKECHTILSQGSSDDFEVSSSPEGLEFKHPKDISKVWEIIGCYDCHKGIQP